MPSFASTTSSSTTPSNPEEPRLVAVVGPLEGQKYALGPAPTSIGRHASSTIQIHHASVSRHHCRVAPEADGAYLATDLDSLCGTFVNGAPIRRRQLEHGDYIKVGESLFLFLTAHEELTLPPAVEAVSFDGASTLEMAVEDSSLLRRTAGGEAGGNDPELQLQALLELATALHTSRSTRDVCQCLIDFASRVLPQADRLTVQLTEDGGTTFAPAAGDDRPLEPGVVRPALDRRRAILANADGDAGGASSVLCSPLAVAEEALGVFYADASAPGREFEPQHLDAMAAAAAITASALGNVLRREWLEAENRRVRQAELDHDIVGESPAMARILGQVARVAPTDLSVLIQGESGTGKELIAGALHRNSPRAAEPFVAINCATLSETLLESELFGHEKGAFTGAVGRKIGQFEIAHRGTLFLDEVGEIPVALQARLLRALEAREIQRLGGRRPIAIDVRLVAATNRDLEAAIRDGSFREDLYHRLNVFSLGLPALRERGEDVVLLAHHFAARSAKRLKRSLLGLAPETRAAIVAYDWPGNVRELRNAMERAVVLAADELLRPEDLPEAVVERASTRLDADGYHAAVADAKRRILSAAIAGADGSYAEAAQRLGLNRTYLHRLVSNLGLRRDD
ncbi:MAG: sigma 54-interacting transcriptional regulator [Acidobacteriota bacterium]